MDVPALGPVFQQPPENGRSTTCGPAALIMARLINRPAFAAATLGDQVRERFVDAVLAIHRRTNTWRGPRGPQLPWPLRYGTQPWALAAQMSDACGVPGSRYRVRLALGPKLADHGSLGTRRSDRRYADVLEGCRAGHCLPIYIGGRYPAHVVLALAATPQLLTVYDPSSGNAETITRDTWRTSTFTVAGWHRVWFTVLPR